MPDINKLHFHTDVDGNILTYCCTDAPDADESAQFAFYVKRNGEIVYRTAYSRESSLQYRMEREGHYQVVFFLKQEDKISLKESEFIPFFSHTAILSGSAELAAIAAERRVTADGAPTFVLLDCLETAMRWTDKIFSAETPDAQQVKEMRQEMEALLGTFPDVPAYWFRWSLWPGRESLRKLHWTLEELYDVCRRSGRMTQELPAIVEKASASSCPPPQSDSAAALYGEFHDAIAERVRIAAERFRNHGIDLMRVTLERDGERLTAQILYDDALEGDRYAFYLLRDNQIIDTVNYGSEMSHTWNIEQEGLYFVQGHISRGNAQAVAQSAPVFYSDGTKFQAFMNNWEYACPGKLSPALEKISIPEPFCDILLVSRKDGASDAQAAGFSAVGELSSGDVRLTIYSGRSPVSRNGTWALLSGRALLKGRLRYGTEALEKMDSLPNLADCYGDYAYCVWNERKLELGADYFAFKRWFYYRNDEFMIVANRYYTLLSALKERNISLTLDADKACVTLSSVSIQILSQNFTRRMGMKDAFQLVGSQYLTWKDGEWTFRESACGAELRRSTVYHEEEYRELLNEAADEIRANVRTVLHDPSHSEFEVDLSGGLDSRVIYSAISAFPKEMERIKINASDTPGSDDLKIAAALNGIYRIPYADYPTSYEPIPLRLADMMYRNIYLGLYYSHGLIGFRGIEPGRLHIIGAAGEIVFRPLYARPFLNLPQECVNSEISLSKVLFKKLSSLMVLDGDTVRENFQNYLAEELALLPGESSCEKLDDIYLFFRSSYHFGDMISILTGGDKVLCIQSKKALRLHHMTFNAHKSIRLQLDMLYKLNPMLASVPFDFEQDNQDRERLKDELVIGDERFRNALLRPVCDLSEWTEAEKRRKAGQTLLAPQGQDYASLNEILYDCLLRNFWRLMRMEPELRERVGPALYHHFTAIQNQSGKIHYWYNKVTSLMDQAQMFRDVASTGNGAPPGAPTLSIFGSCVSRDALEYDTQGGLKLKEYIGRQSIFSSVSPPVPPGRIQIRNPSPFRQKAVERDLNKTAFRLLAENISDFLVIDLIDERFNLLSLCDTLITGSNEFFESVDKEYRKTPARKLNVRDGKLYLGRECVEADLERFCSITLTLYSPERIILHKARMLNQYIAKDGEVQTFYSAQLAFNRRFNAVMDVIFQRMAQYFPGSHIIDELNGILACEDNKWGLAPMHYQPEYYQRVLKRLREIMIEGKD